ncbi:MAG: hypothetical protein COZ70_10405 [Deltaproteobacteria bacterium CG_4_8_14_3_um_filter_51_11]|nr:MAG: hypothetical protein COZ70_10405 [Deltaproteobacteria bacterium CG_4_8_14_3_um_filter_51_11]
MLTRIIKKLEQIEDLISEVKSELSVYETGSTKKSTTRDKTSEMVPSQEELKDLYEVFYKKFEETKGEEIRTAIEEKSRKFVLAFCKANKIPIEASKSSKKLIADEVIKWLSQRRAITKDI